jgi:hypothetical protein
MNDRVSEYKETGLLYIGSLTFNSDQIFNEMIVSFKDKNMIVIRNSSFKCSFTIPFPYVDTHAIK